MTIRHTILIENMSYSNHIGQKCTKLMQQKGRFLYLFNIYVFGLRDFHKHSVREVIWSLIIIKIRRPYPNLD